MTWVIELNLDLPYRSAVSRTLATMERQHALLHYADFPWFILADIKVGSPLPFLRFYISVFHILALF